jgi:hypothetical protein
VNFIQVTLALPTATACQLYFCDQRAYLVPQRSSHFSPYQTNTTANAVTDITRVMPALLGVCIQLVSSRRSQPKQAPRARANIARVSLVIDHPSDPSISQRSSNASRELRLRLAKGRQSGIISHTPAHTTMLLRLNYDRAKS